MVTHPLVIDTRLICYSDNRRGGNRGYGSFGMGMSEGPDVTDGDWRRKPDDVYKPPARGKASRYRPMLGACVLFNDVIFSTRLWRE